MASYISSCRPTHAAILIAALAVSLNCCSSSQAGDAAASCAAGNECGGSGEDASLLAVKILRHRAEASGGVKYGAVSRNQRRRRKPISRSNLISFRGSTSTPEMILGPCESNGDCKSNVSKHEVGAFIISEGQPHDLTGRYGEEVPHKNDYLSIEAGRYKTKPVADWFNQDLQSEPGSEQVIATWSNVDKRPEELNFAFYGTLSLTKEQTVHCKLIRIGQGSTDDWGAHINNWWIGGKYCTFIRDHEWDALKCTCNLSTGKEAYVVFHGHQRKNYSQYINYAQFDFAIS